MGQIEKNAAKLLRNEIGKGKDPSQVFDDFLNFFIDAFDVRHYLSVGGFEKNLLEKAEQNRNFYLAMLDIVQDVNTAIEECRTFDPLGRLYEEFFKNRSKASLLGQFFTPEHVCDLMAETAYDENNSGSVNDPCCGSGRFFIAHRMVDFRHGRAYPALYVGSDIDFMSVRMTAINMMLYGCRGYVEHFDALLYKTLGTRYVVNEVRYPFFTPYYSVRKVMVERKPKEEVVPVQEVKEVKEVQNVKSEVGQLELAF